MKGLEGCAPVFSVDEGSSHSLAKGAVEETESATLTPQGFPGRSPLLRAALRLLRWRGRFRPRVQLFFNSVLQGPQAARNLWPGSTSAFTRLHFIPEGGTAQLLPSSIRSDMITKWKESDDQILYRRPASSPTLTLRVSRRTADTDTESRARRLLIGCQSSLLVSRFVNGPIGLLTV
ncbi:hypothetical protein GW7_05370 [Heterocephalus glaber]|uniref:Uncharacterized protein n=1 Tax=Heterocephalus glaber TaxID=10181 RepID=G5B9Y9_HETGA|nr:hypothetical protein GW7_05370 [Heterocephalus glaber]